MKKIICLGLLFLFCLFIFSACVEMQPGDSITSVEDPSENVETENSNLITLFGGTDNYTIVYPEKMSDALKVAIGDFRSAVKSATGKNPKLSSDATEAVALEILVGPTSRPESTASLEKIDGSGYRIEFVGNKLVITASNDVVFEKAIAELKTLLSVSEKSVSLAGNTAVARNFDSDMIELWNGKKFRYQIILPVSCGEDMLSNVEVFIDKASRMLGISMTYRLDSQVTETEDAYEIVIGRTNRAASTSFYKSIGLFEYGIKTIGNRIVVASVLDGHFSEPLNLLYAALEKSVSGVYRGSAVFDRNFVETQSFFPFAEGMPEMTGGEDGGFYNAENGTFVRIREKTTQSDYNAYLSILHNSGYTTDATYTLGDNRYALLNNGEMTMYISHIKNTGQTRIFCEAYGNSVYPSTEKTTVSGSYTPTLWQVDIDNKGSEYNGGMGYILQAANGSFVIVDGGYQTAAQAEYLWKILSENTPNGQKPVIEGWLLTHLHDDHYGGFIAFADAHSKDVVLKGLYKNIPGAVVNPATALGANTSYNTVGFNGINSAAKKFSDCKVYATLHSGMKFWLAGFEIDVLCTHEDVYPRMFMDINDTSMVFRVTVEGQRILFLGDAREMESDTMMANFDAAVLKSDIVQFAHHGYEGCRLNFYKAVNPETVLWSMPIVGYQQNYNIVPQNCFERWMKLREENKWIVESDSVKKIFVVGQGEVKIRLPYTPSGDKLPDYVAIYQAALNNNT